MSDRSSFERAMDFLSYKDMKIVESKTGQRLAAIESNPADADLPGLMHALHYVLAKRENPQVTYDELEDCGPADLSALLDRLEAPKALSSVDGSATG